ncbi:hypothetical protein AAMO2058_001332500 [Amorphochlora amoebiformis]|eukprot:1387219-Amorphochlora_amoeboformis.AAC.1
MDLVMPCRHGSLVVLLAFCALGGVLGESITEETGKGNMSKAKAKLRSMAHSKMHIMEPELGEDGENEFQANSTTNMSLPLTRGPEEEIIKTSKTPQGKDVMPQVDKKQQAPDYKKRRPVCPGTSLSLDVDQGPATVTAIVMDPNGNRYAMTAYHPLNNAHKTGPGPFDSVIQPAVYGSSYVINPSGYNGGTVDDVFGYVARTKFGATGEDNHGPGVDVALIALCAGNHTASGYGLKLKKCTEIVDSNNCFADTSRGCLVDTTVDYQIGDRVWKMGSHSGYTEGEITQVAASAIVEDHRHTEEFIGQIVVKGMNGERFMKPGDVGAPLMKGNLIIGMLHSFRLSGEAIASPIETIFTSMRVTLDA